ncbi:MAG: FliG C-terminal domain-containing protein [bacterium]
MRSICLYFQVHQPFRLRTYRFFNIGHDHHYYDDYQNRHIIRRVAEKCYLPANRMMLDLIKEFGAGFRISYSISGTALDQFSIYVPEVIHSFQELARTGNVEFISETYAHSLASLGRKDEFLRQVNAHSRKIQELFGVKPTTFRNTELIYSDQIGESIADMGFHTMLTEGAKHVLGWKSPNFLYCNNINPKLKLLLRNFRLSDDLTFRFSNNSWSEWPLTADKFTKWLNAMNPGEEVVNLFIDYETIGEHQWKETGIFDFFKDLPSKVYAQSDFGFFTPEDLYQRLQTVASISVPHAISWADEERDLTAWRGNELQDEAFEKLYSYEHKVSECEDQLIQRDWLYLQTSNHFYYMCTKWFSAGEVHKHFNPYKSPYEAFINYMNVLSDFMIRVDTYLEKKNEITVALANSVASSSDPEGELPIRKMRRSAPAKKKQVQKKAKPAKPESVYKKLNFDDLATISDRRIKELIKKVDIETLSGAMKNADEEVKAKVEKNMGKKVLSVYKEIIQKLKKINSSEVSAYRKQIVKEINKLSK